MSTSIAVLNSGSSSIKFAIFDLTAGFALQFRGLVERIGIDGHLKVTDAAGKVVEEKNWKPGELTHEAATHEIFTTATRLRHGQPVQAVGHRVVHGGMQFDAPAVVDANVLEALKKLIPLAPLHQPHNLEPIEIIAKAAPQLPQVACFDTAFHRRQRAEAQSFALPRAITKEGVRRYGFHGLSYEFIVSRLRATMPDLAQKKLIVAHLGNGASLCAIDQGLSVASTMGFTAVDGLMMGTRCGTIDPGVLLYLMDEHKMDSAAIADLIYRKSGLLGVSGISSDMRQLRQSAAVEAREAIDLFVYRIIREIGSLAAALGGLDALVFTAGIGENDAATRAAVCSGCTWLGLALDPSRNAAGQGKISTDDSRMSAWVVPTDEEAMIARHTAETLRLLSR